MESHLRFSTTSPRPLCPQLSSDSRTIGFLWYFRDAHFCPPGLFEKIDGGSSASDGGDEDDDSSSTSTYTVSSTTESETPTQTAAGFHIDNDGTFPEFDDREYTSLFAATSAFSIYVRQQHLLSQISHRHNRQINHHLGNTHPHGRRRMCHILPNGTLHRHLLDLRMANHRQHSRGNVLSLRYFPRHRSHCGHDCSESGLSG